MLKNVSFYCFWVIKGKPKREGGEVGGVNLKQNLKHSSKSGYGKIKIVSRFLKPIPSILGKYLKIVENKN